MGIILIDYRFIRIDLGLGYYEKIYLLISVGILYKLNDGVARGIL